MKKTLTALVLAGTLAITGIGCNQQREVEEKSDLFYEDAVVSETVYSPSKHGSGTGVGPTFNMDGDIGISITSVSVDVPEKYAVVFKCKHGKFIIEGKGKKYKELWGRFESGDSVSVSYKEVYKSTYKDTNDDGKEELIKKSLVDYDFLDAQLKSRKK